MALKTIRLYFRAPVHFGSGRLSDGGFTCDAATLFSALFIEALHEGCHEELLARVSKGSMAFSDAFPFAGSSNFLPRPMLPPEVVNSDMQRKASERDSRWRKAAKKLEYVSSDHYGEYLRGELNPICELERFDVGVASARTKVSLVNRDFGDAEPYHVGAFSFKSGAGLYFLYEGEYDLRPLLDQLAYSGIGGKRSSGYGRFDYEVLDGSPLDKVKPSGLCRWVLLSSAIPTDEELSDSLLEDARYRLVKKSGFVQSESHSARPQKKRDAFCFAPGSTFARRFVGDIVDVNATAGSHPVYRYARAMWLEV